MNFKQFFKNIGNKISELWHKRKIERTFNITYDIVWSVILFFMITGVLVTVFAGGVGAGYFASLVKDEPIRDREEMQKDIYNYEETSRLYFANNKYIGEIRADLHREEVELKDVSELVTNAVIATEDEMFYEHNGVVPKAIVRAIVQEVTNSDRKTGGSTLTQQLIKNQILTNEVSFERKAKEILLAMRLENFFEKDEILEAYLNIVPFGRDASGHNVAGIQTAAKGIFGVNADEVTLPQAAFLAGLPQNPYVYTPFTNKGEVKEEDGLEYGIQRMQVVLKRMHQAGFINEKEYEKAANYDITADFTKKKSSPIDKYPAVVLELEKRAHEILKEQIAKEDGYTIDEVNENEELKEQYSILADRALRMNGYHIHSTIDKKMYDTMQQVVKEYQYFGPDRTFSKGGENVTEQVEIGAEMIENKTGKILSFVPGRDFRAGEREVNYATGYGGAGRQPGSTFKPIAVYAPAMEMGAIQPGSVIADIPGHPGYAPNNYGGAFYGLVSAREALTYSYNVSTAEIYKKILHANPAKEYVMKMGIPLTTADQENPSLALGTNDVTVEQNTGAFATFSNGGNYIKPYMIEKITDSDGNVIYEHKPEPVEVFSPQTAYLTIDMLRDVIRKGTGFYLTSQLRYGGVDWAGKTGTSQKYKDAWFVGTNPNVTMGVWLGYNTPHSIYHSNTGLSYSQRTQKIWAQLINAVGEINPELIAPKERYKQPDGIVWRNYCATSGLIPSKICANAGLVQSDIYNAKYVPGKTDDSLVGGNMPLVVVDGKQMVAGPNTPPEFTTEQKGGFAFNPEFLQRMGYNRLGDLSVLIPRKNREKWEKIGLKGAGTSVSGSDIANDDGRVPPAPSSLSASKSNISWAGAKGHLIVGYRIYYGSEEGSSFKLIGHTVGTSYSIPNREGAYHVRAVNYFGRESEPSSTFIVEKEEEELEKETEEKQEKEKADKERQKEEEKRKKEEEKKKKEEEKRKEEEEKKKKEEDRKKEEEQKQEEQDDEKD